MKKIRMEENWIFRPHKLNFLFLVRMRVTSFPHVRSLRTNSLILTALDQVPRVKMLISVQVCIGVKVLREWEVLDVNSESTIGEVSTESALDRSNLPTGSAFQNNTLIHQWAVASRLPHLGNFNPFPSVSRYKTLLNSASTWNFCSNMNEKLLPSQLNYLLFVTL